MRSQGDLDTEFLSDASGALQPFFEMVQGYAQENSRSACGWLSSRSCSPDCPSCFQVGAGICLFISYSYQVGATYEQWPAYFSEEFKLRGFTPHDRETGGTMLSVTGLTHFYYLCDFTDMRCKHSRVLSVIREQLHREPNPGDVYIVLSKNRRIVRMFAYDNRSYSLFEKKFVADYQFMKIEFHGADTVYRIDWRDVVLLLENPIVKTLNVK